MSSLDLYAAVEDLLGFEEQIETLYDLHLKELKSLGIDTLLDIGCGSGNFAKRAQDGKLRVLGIDLSDTMVQRAKAIGIDAQCIDLCKLEGEFDAACAIFDVLNYIPSSELAHFLNCVEERLVNGGFFLADINTLYGFEEVAVGAIGFEDENRDLIIQADFEDGKLTTQMKLFRRENDLYSREQGSIVQFFHDVKAIEASTKMKLIKREKVALYGAEADKEFLVFQKKA